MGHAMNDDVKRDEGLDTLTADHDPAPSAPAPSANQPAGSGAVPEATATQPAPEAYGGGAIRGAYLARRLTVEAEGTGAAEHETIVVSALVRGAYVAHLSTPDSGSVGDEHAGTTDLLRGIYAARVTAAGRSAATVVKRGRPGKAAKPEPRKGKATKAKKATPAQRSASRKAVARTKTSRRSRGKRGGGR
jgi:hypothetical protein